jgi:hypothetical protein
MLPVRQARTRAEEREEVFTWINLRMGELR